MKRVLIFIIIVVQSQIATSQALNKKSILTECKTYVLNPSKIKARLYAESVAFGLEKLEVKEDKPINIRFKGCSNKLEVTTPNSSLEEVLSEVLEKEYPKINSTKMKIVVSDVHILENKLPSVNARLYLSTDFYLKNSENSYSLVYSVTNYAPLVKYIEKPLGRLLGNSIETFFNKKHFFNTFEPFEGSAEPSTGSALQKGIYTTFQDILTNTPTYNYSHVIEGDTTQELRSKYTLKDSEGTKVSEPVIAFHDGLNAYLNVGYYYSKNYFVELSELNEDYFFIYDRVYDSSKASKTTTSMGGGLLGALAGSASAGMKVPALIDRLTGEMKCFDKKKMKSALSNNPDLLKTYEKLIDSDDREGVILLFGRLLNQRLID